jgi:hypothetical protein
VRTLDCWRRKQLAEYFDGAPDTFPKALVAAKKALELDRIRRYLGRDRPPAG